ncbi:MAG: hypothetical protein ACI9QL_002960 [Candidatus Omnitrophota bacterium]|jgi:hypothetical protein
MMKISTYSLIPLFLASTGVAQWNGFVDQSTILRTDTFSFGGTNPEAGDSNENYYDGDFGDFDHDGRLDRAVISRYGLLWNAGGGVMMPVANTIPGGTYQFGDKDRIGNDATVWVDFNNDGWEDTVQGGNSEPLTFQVNNKGRFTLLPKKSGSAREIRKIDLENDGDVDLLITSTFCFTRSCGLPVDFKVWQNDGNGDFTEVTVAAGLSVYRDERLTDVQVGDLDLDGDFDFVVYNGGRQAVNDDFDHANGGRAQLMARFNNGSGVFTEERVFYNVPATVASLGDGAGPGGGGENQALGDIDGDGDLDLAVTAPGALGSHPNVAHALFLNDGSGNFQEVSANRFDTGTYTGLIIGKQIKFADVDHDGDLDLVSYIQTDEDEPGHNNQGENLAIFLNDGLGWFTFAPGAWERFDAPPAGGLFTLDIADLTGDGALDLWLGHQDDDVNIQVNTYTDPQGLPPDQPRNLQVVSADSSGVRLSWQAPPFASTVRFYRVYRTMAPGLMPMDRPLIKTIACTPFADDALIAPITTNTTTAYLGDPDVVLDGANNRITYTDTNTAVGVVYYYSVVHVGPETKPSLPTPEVSTVRPLINPPPLDTTSPSLEFISPVFQDWSAYPRIVLHYGDAVDVDSATLRVSMDAPLGDGTPANTDISDRFLRKDGNACILALSSPASLPLNTLVRITASIQDLAGNASTNQVLFFVSATSAQLPTASIQPSVTSGAPPLTVDFDGSLSSDPDGKIMRWEWYFPDGSSGIGQLISKTFPVAGVHRVQLIVRDNEGGANAASVNITVGEGLNQPPIADAGSSIRRVDVDDDGFEPVNLNGSGSIDLDGSIIDYRWFENLQLLATSVTATVILPVGCHAIDLVVTDNLDARSTNQVEVTILPKAGGLILYWSMDETSGNVANDFSGYGNDGTSSDVTRESGIVNGAYGFHGNINYYVRRNPVLDFPTNEISTLFWIFTGDSNDALVSYATGNGSDSEQWTLWNTANLRVYRGAASIDTGVVFNDVAWHHVGVTWRGSDGQLEVYRDGGLAFTGTLAAGSLIPPGGSLVIGQEQDNIGGGFQRPNSLSAQYDELRIYDRVLIGSEIQELIRDGDQDRLPDNWEAGQFGDLASTGIGDNDLDRWTNYDEYVSGSNPLNPTSYLRLLLSGPGQELFFTTVPANGAGYENLTRRYALIYSADLQIPATAWPSLNGYENIVGNGQAVSYSLRQGTNRHFRVRTWLE